MSGKLLISLQYKDNSAYIANSFAYNFKLLNIGFQMVVMVMVKNRIPKT